MVTYAKLEDDFPEHRKVVGLSDAAFRLYVTALCYSSRNLTDGFIPAGVIRRLGGTSKTTAELTAATLWHGQVEPPGWHIHDYLEHQRSKSQIDGIRETKSKAGAIGAASRWHPDDDGKGDSKPMHREQRTESETDLNSSSSSARARDASEWFEAVTHRVPPNAVFREMLLNIDAAHPPECIRAIFEKSSDKDDPWTYAKRIFDSCLVEGHEPRGRNGKPVRARPEQSAAGTRGGRRGVEEPRVDPAFDKYS